MRRLTILLVLILASLSLGAAGRIALLAEGQGLLPYSVMEMVGKSFESGFTEEGLNVVPDKEVESINTVIDISKPEQLAMLASALNCDYIATLRLDGRSWNYNLTAEVFDAFTGEIIDGYKLLNIEKAKLDKELIFEATYELAGNLPVSGPLVELREGGEPARVARMAIGAGYDIEWNDYLWIYRFEEPLIHPDTGEALTKQGLVVIGVARVEKVEGRYLSLLALSEPSPGYTYTRTDRLRLFSEKDYEEYGFSRGIVTSFSTFGFGAAFDGTAIILPTNPSTPTLPSTPPRHPSGPESVEFELVEQHKVAYEPVSISADYDGLAVVTDDDRIELLPLKLNARTGGTIVFEDPGSVARLDGVIYAVNDWDGELYKINPLSGDRKLLNDELDIDLLTVSGDGSLWCTVFSYFAGMDLLTYPALRLSTMGQVVEARAIGEKTKALAITADGTIYTISVFGLVSGLRPSGDSFELGTRMLRNPLALAVDAMGWVYVVDGDEGLVVFNSVGEIVGRWSGGAMMDFSQMDSIALVGNDIYLSSVWEQNIVHLTLDYSFPKD